MTTAVTRGMALRIDAALSIHEETFTEYSQQDGVTEFLGAFATVRYLGGEVATHVVVDVDMANEKICIVGDDGGRTWLSLFDLESVEIVSSPCLTGNCDHSPYDPECADPDYLPQPCCKVIVHVDQIGSDDPDDHDTGCPSFDPDDDDDGIEAAVRAAVARGRR